MERIWFKIKHNRKQIKYTNETRKNVTYVLSCIKEIKSIRNFNDYYALGYKTQIQYHMI